MEPKFNTSFIPKKPIVETPAVSGKRSGSFNILSALSTLIFIVTILAAGGLFVYKNVLNGQIAKAEQEVNDAREAFQTQKIQDLLDANARIVATKNLMNSHVAVSELVALLQNLTLKTVKYTKLTYNSEKGAPTLNIDAEARSYNALADLSDQFLKNDFVKGQIFSNFNLVDNGNVKVNIFATLDPSLTSYKRALDVKGATQ